MGRILFTPHRVITPPYYPVSYGLLYNWYAATDVRNITSEGDFVVPSKANWETLLNYIDDYDEISGRWNLAGGLLKSIGLDFWNTPNEGAVNSFNFNARGAGCRQFEGVFGAGDTIIKEFSGFISNSEYDIDNLWTTVINNLFADASVISNAKKDGLSIRLVRPATAAEQLLYDGTACEPYTGNDGKIYRTVKIGTQVWTADNLAETKFRNGDLIPEVTDNAAWAALTTGALCAYNNDWNNV